MNGSEFRVVWQQCPHVQYPRNVIFIEATDKDAAERIARDYIERTHRITWFSIHSCELYERPTGGRVLEAQ
jgi:hypothetical protein